MYKMKPLIQAFPQHIQESISIGQRISWNSDFKPQNIIISGLGGSGIGGTIVSAILSDKLSIPLIINKGYKIPSFVSKNTLFIASSYSGNTEETLFALEHAQKAGAHIVCLSSGGTLIEKAQKEGWNYVLMPDGFPPRAAFGYSSTQLFYILEKYHLIDRLFEKSLLHACELMQLHFEDIQKEAKQIAQRIYNKYTVLYVEDAYEGVAIRFRQQINENGKNLCWHHVIPEMNHNELVGWTEKHESVVSIFIRTKDEFERNTARFKINQDIISPYAECLEIAAMGNDKIERTYYLVHLTDWVSFFISELKKIDATEVRVIDFLKTELSKI